MFAQLLASAPTHDEGARPTIISGLVHFLLIALAVQATRSIAAVPLPHAPQNTEVYLAPAATLPVSASSSAATSASSAVAPAPVNFPAAPAIDFTGELPQVTIAAGPRGYDPTATAVQSPPIIGGRPGPDNAPWQSDMVDEPVSNQRGPKPVYPAVLAQSGVAGEVTLRYIVDADGKVESGSIVVLSATRGEFIAPAMEAIRQSRFSPARRRGVAVRQLVEQRVKFSAGRAL